MEIIACPITGGNNSQIKLARILIICFAQWRHQLRPEAQKILIESMLGEVTSISNSGPPDKSPVTLANLAAYWDIITDFIWDSAWVKFAIVTDYANCNLGNYICIQTDTILLKYGKINKEITLDLFADLIQDKLIIVANQFVSIEVDALNSQMLSRYYDTYDTEPQVILHLALIKQLFQASWSLPLEAKLLIWSSEIEFKIGPTLTKRCSNLLMLVLEEGFIFWELIAKEFFKLPIAIQGEFFLVKRAASYVSVEPAFKDNGLDYEDDLLHLLFAFHRETVELELLKHLESFPQPILDEIFNRVVNYRTHGHLLHRLLGGRSSSVSECVELVNFIAQFLSPTAQAKLFTRRIPYDENSLFLSISLPPVLLAQLVAIQPLTPAKQVKMFYPHFSPKHCDLLYIVLRMTKVNSAYWPCLEKLIEIIDAWPNKQKNLIYEANQIGVDGCGNALSSQLDAVIAKITNFKQAGFPQPEWEFV